MTEREQLEGGIAALESQRAVLGDAVVDTALAALRAKLERLDSPGQQLRPVTVLFADVVESTTLSRRLDPEDVHAIMDGALQHFTSIVEAQHGRVLQYAGDGLLAVFGAVDEEGLAHVARVEAGIDAADDPNGAPALLWTCHTVLVAAKSPRANEVLSRAHSVLMERAELLDETDRATFLGNVPSHRAIMTAWAAAT